VELAVTTSMTINFLHKPAAVALVADARIVKLGKRLAFGDVFVYAPAVLDIDQLGSLNACAHVSGTYSIPPSVKHTP
jgi:acyl-coenzyme A thioesterase PaaI-like protein